jgi:hypothetical protein
MYLPSLFATPKMDSSANKDRRIGEIIPCPDCDGNVRIPEGVSIPINVRCPRCQHEFELGEWLDAWVPMLEIVSNGEVDEDTILAIDVQRDERNFEPANKVSDVRVSKPRFTSETSAISRANNGKRKSGRRSSRQRSRSSLRPKRKDGKAELIKMVCGGLLALPVAQLIIWWALHKDPLKLAPIVERVAPVLIPKVLESPPRPKEMTEEEKRLYELAHDNSDPMVESLSELKNEKLSETLKNKFYGSDDEDNSKDPPKTKNK